VQVGNAEVYLLALSSNGCIVASDKKNLACKPCTKNNCNNWASRGMGESLLCQPCQCSMEYDGCDLRWEGGNDGEFLACPAAPPSLFSNLCPTVKAPSPSPTAAPPTSAPSTKLPTMGKGYLNGDDSAGASLNPSMILALFGSFAMIVVVGA